MNIGKKQKSNPWRNTRRDFNMPWNDIWAAIFMAILPMIIVILASNFVLRSGAFYSNYMTKTEIIKEIPYQVESDDITNTFENFMLHKSSEFKLIEKSDYQPQEVFTKRAGNIMSTIRTSLDVALVIGVVLLIGAVAIVCFLKSREENRLILESFKTSWIWFAVVMAVNAIIFLIPSVRGVIFQEMFGVRFEPGDVLIQIFDAKLPVYFGVWQLMVSLVIMIAVTYIINKLFGRRKMFRA